MPNNNTPKASPKTTTQVAQGQSAAPKPRVVPPSSVTMQVRNGSHVRTVKGK